MKKIMGFSPDCLNNGHKNLRGDCICSEHFKGELCEQIICENNGVPKKLSTNPVEEICQ